MQLWYLFSYYCYYHHVVALLLTSWCHQQLRHSWLQLLQRLQWRLRWQQIMSPSRLIFCHLQGHVRLGG